MEIQDSISNLNQLSQQLITDIMCISQLSPDFQSTVYVEEEGDYPVYTRYQISNLRYSDDASPLCSGINPLTNERRDIFLSEIAIEWLADIHNTLSVHLTELPAFLSGYTIFWIEANVFILTSKDNKLCFSYFFCVNGTKYLAPIKEGFIRYTQPLVTKGKYSIKFQKNCVDGFCVFQGRIVLECFWSFRDALKFMQTIA